MQFWSLLLMHKVEHNSIIIKLALAEASLVKWVTLSISATQKYLPSFTFPCFQYQTLRKSQYIAVSRKDKCKQTIPYIKDFVCSIPPLVSRYWFCWNFLEHFVSTKNASPLFCWNWKSSNQQHIETERWNS